MTALTITLAGAAVIASVAAASTMLALRRLRAAARREVAELGARLAALEAGLDQPGGLDQRGGLDELDQRGGLDQRGRASEPEFVITHLGEVAEPAPVVPVRLSGPAFADAVLRETVVQTASLVHGVRRALAPETRNRIRFEMRRELKRSRKERKVEVREALREYRARHRAEVGEAARGAEGAA